MLFRIVNDIIFTFFCQLSPSPPNPYTDSVRSMHSYQLGSQRGSSGIEIYTSAILDSIILGLASYSAFRR